MAPKNDIAKFVRKYKGTGKQTWMQEYIRLAKKLHPNRGGAKENFQALQQALNNIEGKSVAQLPIIPVHRYFNMFGNEESKFNKHKNYNFKDGVFRERPPVGMTSPKRKNNSPKTKPPMTTNYRKKPSVRSTATMTNNNRKEPSVRSTATMTNSLNPFRQGFRPKIPYRNVKLNAANNWWHLKAANNWWHLNANKIK